VKQLSYASLSLALLVSGVVSAQAQTGQATPTRTDIYHVSFSKAALGEAAALGDDVRTPDPKAPQPGHFLVLRHLHGDDWDYCVIEHLGPKAAVEVPPAPAANVLGLRAWHEDTFAAGPAWPEFARAMGIGAQAPANGVYVVSMWRAAPGPGHREALERTMGQPAPDAKVPIGNVLLQHVEGGAWQYLAISRYNSWQDFATDQGAPGAASDAWADARKHGSFHRDTIADRLPSK
jgi:hypothetical protein